MWDSVETFAATASVLVLSELNLGSYILKINFNVQLDALKLSRGSPRGTKLLRVASLNDRDV